MRLNLGCGTDVLDGYENYDKYPLDDRVRFIDLESPPLPFNDNSVDEVFLQHVYEHLDVNPTMFFSEMYRILKPDGILRVVLPVWGSIIKHKHTYYSREYLMPLQNPMLMGTKTFTMVDVKKGKRFGHNGFFYRLHRLYRLWIDLGVEQYESSFRKE